MPRVTLLHSPAARQVTEQVIDLPDGATVADAVRVAGWSIGEGEAVGVWGRKATPAQALHEGDRVERVRPLLVDPKVARRERFKRQGSRSAGLFSTRRPGAKPGY
jgi:putative ubiquitin-RnfH superfamily antitoxin RatB of RatAB toxin-antitoxin module